MFEIGLVGVVVGGGTAILAVPLVKILKFRKL